MILSKTTEYAIRILSFMSLRNEKLFSAKFLQDNLKIPPRYLMRLLTALSKSGFIQSIQGRNGGYVFVKNLDQIYISDIMKSVEGKNPFNECILGFEECLFLKPCAMHHVWADAKETIMHTFETTSLADSRKQQITQH